MATTTKGPREKKSKTPVHFDAEIADEILGRMANGESLNAILRSDQARYPTYAGFYFWMNECQDGRDTGDEARAALLEKYKRAQDARRQFLEEEILEIADAVTPAEVVTKIEAIETGENGRTKTETRTVTSDAVDRARLRVDARKWVVSRMDTKRDQGDGETGIKVTGGLPEE